MAGFDVSLMPSVQCRATPVGSQCGRHMSGLRTSGVEPPDGRTCVRSSASAPFCVPEQPSVVSASISWVTTTPTA